MEFSAFLDHLRDAYLVEFEAAYEQQKSERGAIHPEVAFEISGDTYRHIYVVDFIAGKAGRGIAIEVNPGRQAYVSGGPFVYDGMTVSFRCASWDGMAFALTPVTPQLHGFEPWFDRWVNLDEQSPVVGGHHSGGIHSAVLGERHLEVDFGTAPIDALTGLLKIFAENGVREVKVASSKTPEPCD
ncbi:hypothetical protein [Sinirhodobacter huangdaonensis]|uniref:Uncharacterized protein n=1 Tax=Paenirhodobacter huangdaonensis TaxID=2501515 RepID=A0A3S3MMP2_9RHOB|nr:hypothetical protein [Sinirhodobacter huangdaonensis]RWR48910.1 hypothetical protein EOW66_17475 [Sinirhodobacter huangdaonensis]